MRGHALPSLMTQCRQRETLAPPNSFVPTSIEHKSHAMPIDHGKEHSMSAWPESKTFGILVPDDEWQINNRASGDDAELS